jgi:NAD(P)H dehydrogenase (quinone)
MPKVLITYFSQSGHTEKLANLIAGGVREGGVEVTIKPVSQTNASELPSYDGIMVGSPVYYGTMAAPIKQLFDESVQFHGRLDGKAGGAFATSANLAGGNETTITDILHAMLIHGMVVQGDPRGDHYGAVTLENATRREEENARRQGQRFAQLVKRLGK